jgi:hypothetical protein
MEKTKKELEQLESNQRQWFDHLEHESRMNVLGQAEEMNLFSILKPKVSIDGDQYCVLYGEDLQSGICGFGDTIILAIRDFNASFTRKNKK